MNYTNKLSKQNVTPKDAQSKFNKKANCILGTIGIVGISLAMAFCNPQKGVQQPSQEELYKQTFEQLCADIGQAYVEEGLKRGEDINDLIISQTEYINSMIPEITKMVEQHLGIDTNNLAR